MNMRIAFILVALGAVLVESTYSMSNDRRMSRRRDTALATDIFWNRDGLDGTGMGLDGDLSLRGDRGYRRFRPRRRDTALAKDIFWNRDGWKMGLDGDLSLGGDRGYRRFRPRRRDTALAKDISRNKEMGLDRDVLYGGDMGLRFIRGSRTDNSDDVTNTAPVEAVDCAIKKSELRKVIEDLKPAMENVLKVLIKEAKELGFINTVSIQTKEDRLGRFREFDA